jgi:3-oxoacyl-[acyl-carrier-protein] synthase-3
MSRILAIGRHIPQGRADNRTAAGKFDLDEDFLAEKLGVLRAARRAPDEETSDLCVAAFHDLARRTGLTADGIDAVIVVTQNPDGRGLPHTAAAVHAKIGAPASCAAFDISQGCAGFVYGLSISEGFLAAAGLKRAVLFTADPYSKIIDPDDRNTALLFGDAAAATLIEAGDAGPGWRPSHFRFQSLSAERDALENRGGTLYMNGRGIFNFAATGVPREVQAVLAAAGLEPAAIDLFALHQGSKYIVDALCKRLALPAEKVPYDILDYGNTVSSSIPLLLSERLDDPSRRRMLLCGFGVGLSTATCLLTRAA